jgi:hypothetical protein
LFWHKSQPGCHLPSTFEGFRISNAGNQCSGGDESDAWDLPQSLTRRIGAVPGLQLLFDGLHLPVELAEVIEQAAE